MFISFFRWGEDPEGQSRPLLLLSPSSSNLLHYARILVASFFVSFFSPPPLDCISVRVLLVPYTRVLAGPSTGAAFALTIVFQLLIESWKYLNSVKITKTLNDILQLQFFSYSASIFNYKVLEKRSLQQLLLVLQKI